MSMRLPCTATQGQQDMESGEWERALGVGQLGGGCDVLGEACSCLAASLSKEPGGDNQWPLRSLHSWHCDTSLDKCGIRTFKENIILRTHYLGQLRVSKGGH